MTDMPRHHYKAHGPDGERLGASAINLCSYLWSFLSAKDRSVGGFVWHTATRLADELEWDKRTIERQLQQLRLAGLLQPARDITGRPGFVLLVLREHGPGIADRSAARAPIVSSEIADRPGGDRRSSVRRSPIVLAEIADPPGASKEEQEGEQEGEQEREQDPLALARSLVAVAKTPDGAPDLETTKPALRTLLRLLAEGESPAKIAEVLMCADRIVARGLERPALFGSEMFIGGVWAGWRRSAFELQRLEEAERATAAHRQATEVATEAANRETARLAARDAERSEVRALCHRMREAVRRPDSIAGLLAESDAFECALTHDPAAACEAMQAVVRDGGDDVTAAAIRAAVVALGVRPPPKMGPDDFLAIRERAEREGRNPFELLAELGCSGRGGAP